MTFTRRTPPVGLEEVPAPAPAPRKRGRPPKNPEVVAAVKAGVLAPVPPILVDRETAAALVGLSPSTMHTLALRGKFPRPRKASANRAGWIYSELVAWAQGLPFSDILPPSRGPTEAH